MPILNINNYTELQRFEHFLLNARHTSLTQSIDWGNVKTDWYQEGVYIEEHGEIVIAAVVRFRKLPFVNTHYAFVSDGPVMNEFSINLFNKLVDEIMILRKKYNFFMIKFDPLLKYSEELENEIRANGYKLLSRGTDNHITIRSRYNFVLDLKNQTEETLMPSFAEKTRYNIRLAVKKGVKIHYSRSDMDLKAFYEIYLMTTGRHSIGNRDFTYFKRMIDEIDPADIRIYIGTFEEKPICGAIAVKHGKTLTYLYGASSDEYRNTMPNYLMQWEMIKWAIAENCHNYNMTGVFVLNNSDGLYRFKSGFCKKDGITEYIGEIDKVCNAFLYNFSSKIIPKIKSSKILKVGQEYKRKNKKRPPETLYRTV